MKEITKLEALRRSVKKWSNVHIGTGKDQGEDNCALCQKYLISRGSCMGCPVAESVGQFSCLGTPFASFQRHQYIAHDIVVNISITEDCEECEKLAFAEWEFLYDLYLKELVK